MATRSLYKCLEQKPPPKRAEQLPTPTGTLGASGSPQPTMRGRQAKPLPGS